MRNLGRFAPVLVLAAVLVLFSQRSGQATARHELHQGWVTGFNALLDAKARAVVVHA